MGGYLLDGVLPTREAIRELVVQLTFGRWHTCTMLSTLEKVDQLTAEMHEADQSRTAAVAQNAATVVESNEKV